MSEDCLFLNIWAPRAALDQLYYSRLLPAGTSTRRPQVPLLPVLVFFHGGGFTMGSGNSDIFNGTVLSSFNNIVVVTVQYRLGALGFLYSGSEDAPGNMGLWDQLEALKWVNENIEHFGGNPNHTTIAGQNGGAASVSYHLLSPYSRKYFQKAIMQSGSAISDWSYLTQTEAVARSNRLAQVMSNECNDGARTNSDTTVADRINCLRSLDAMKFAQRQGEVLLQDESGSVGLFPYPFTPVIDGDFVPRNPRDMLKVGDFFNTSILLGIDKEEGALPVQLSNQGLKLLPNPLVPNRTFEGFDFVSYEGFINSYFHYYPRNGIQSFPVIEEGIRLIYSALSSNGEILMGRSVVDKVVQAVGDWALTCPTITWADAYAAAPDDFNVRVFLYAFTHRSSQNRWPAWTGVPHGEELAFVWGEPFANYAAGMEYTDEEKLLSRVMMAYWANFAKFGDPNRPDPSSRNQANSLSLRPWPEYDASLGQMTANINIETRVRQEGDGNIYGLKRKECAVSYYFRPILILSF